MLIGQRIRQLREQKGLSQGQLQQASGLPRAYISRVEHGDRVVRRLKSFAHSFSGNNLRIATVWKCGNAWEISREGRKLGRRQQHQTPIHAGLDRLGISDETSSGSLLPIVSMMQTTDARE